jgi:hypothetical protein
MEHECCYTETYCAVLRTLSLGINSYFIIHLGLEKIEE